MTELAQIPNVERAEQRRERRQRVLKGATVLTGIKDNEIKCTLKNQSEHGAELRIMLGAIIPHEFLLYVPVDAIAYRCVVRWRLENRIGVMFVGTEPKPSWLYG